MMSQNKHVHLPFRAFSFKFKLLFLVAFLLSIPHSWAQTTSVYKVAILEFNISNPEHIENIDGYGQEFASFLETELANSLRFTVVERKNLSDLFKEINLSEEGFVTPEDAKKYGEIKSADIVIYGDIIIYSKDEMTVNAKLVQVASSEIDSVIPLEPRGRREFSEKAKEFISKAEARFPLLGIVQTANGKSYIRIGSAQGVTTKDQGGRIVRPKELFGSMIPEDIGTFEVVPGQLFPNATEIALSLYPGLELQDGDYAEFSKRVPELKPNVQERLGQLNIQGTPSGAELYFNDTFLGSFGSERLDVSLPLGTGKLEVKAKNYESKSLDITIDPQRAMVLDVNLSPLKAQVNLTISETSYEVFINGLSQGQSSQLSLSPGDYSLEIKTPNTEPFQQTLSLSAGQVLSLPISLVALKAGLSLKITPTNAVVKLNNEPIDIAMPLTFEAGNYLLYVEADGFEPLTETLVLSSGQTLEKVFALTPLALNNVASASNNAETDQSTKTSAPPDASNEVSDPSSPDEIFESSTAEAETAPELKPNQGLVRLSSNFDGAEVTFINVLSAEEITVALSDSHQLALDDGFYDVFASAPGGASYQPESLNIRAGSENQLDLIFKEISIGSGLYLGSLLDDDGLQLLLVGSLSNQDLKNLSQISISGPEGWNNNESWTIPRLYWHLNKKDILEWQIELQAGTYSLNYTLTSGSLSKQITLDDTSLAQVRTIAISPATANELGVSWSRLSDAKHYEVFIFQQDKLLVNQKTNDLSINFASLNLQLGNSYDACVLAQNWADSLFTSDQALRASWACQSFTVSETIKSNTSTGPSEPECEIKKVCPSCPCKKD